MCIAPIGDERKVYKTTNNHLPMSLKELKKEVSELQDLPNTLQQFQGSWLQPFRKDDATHAFLRTLPPEVRRKLNRKLALMQQQFQEIKAKSTVTNDIERMSHLLIEMKLQLFQGNGKQAAMLAREALQDEAINVRKTIADSLQFDVRVEKLSEHYQDISALLHKHLSLEDAVTFMELPHYFYLQSLRQTSKRQSRLARDLGQHFVTLTKEANKEAKEASLKNLSHK